jgi:hypothetical protein
VKKTVFSILAVTLGILAGLALPGAQAKDAGLPEYVGIFAGRSTANGPFVALERITPVQQTRVRAFGFGGAEAHYSFTGETSPVRFKAGDHLEFIVRTATQDQDPATLVQFNVLKDFHGDRILPLANVVPFAVRASDVSHEQSVAFDAAKYGTNFFKIVPTQPLPPGEYALSTSAGRDGFLFGIDP